MLLTFLSSEVPRVQSPEKEKVSLLKRKREGPPNRKKEKTERLTKYLITVAYNYKVEQTGALNFCLHAVGRFIHLHHVQAGIQNFIHLRHPAASAGNVHASKN